MSEDTDTMTAAADAFAKLGAPLSSPAAEVDEPRDDDDVEGEQPLDEGDEAEDNGHQSGHEPEASEAEEEPAAPAIDPPVSWDAEAKKVFAGLPPEAQRIIADRESGRERAINAKASEAAEARKQAQSVTQHAADLHRQYADRLAEYARAFEPQRPDYALIATDPQAYAQQMAMFEAATAQRDQIAQQAMQANSQAEAIQQHQAQAERQQFHETLSQAWGEKWSDPEQRKATIAELEQIADWLGYSKEDQARAGATDFLGLRKIADLKADAEKWRTLQANKMALVRDAKQKPKTQTPGTAQPKGSERQGKFQDSMSRLRTSGDLKDAAAAFRNLG